MAITEKQRHELFTKAEEVLGEANAETLMSHLPPVGWADVATTRDLDGLRSDFNAQRVSMKQDMELLRLELRGEMTRGFATMTRTYVITSFGSAIAVASLVLAAVRL